MYRYFFKRIFDLIFTFVVFPFFLLLLIFIAPIIFLEDRGSIFYNAPRLGRNGKIFKMYKFRSMKVNAPDLRNDDGSTFNSENDQRLTIIGKFLRKTSLDETPQIFNVLKGDMSIIGPRPDLPEHINYYSFDDSNKLKVRPGVTGYNQAFFRNTVSWKQKIKNDLFYIDNISMVFDIKIFVKTFFSVIKRKNIFNHTEIEKSKIDGD